MEARKERPARQGVHPTKSNFAPLSKKRLRHNHPIEQDPPRCRQTKTQIPPRCLRKSVTSRSSLRSPAERTPLLPASSATARAPRSSSRSAASATCTPSSSRTATRPRSLSSLFPLSSSSRTFPRRTPRAARPPHKRLPSFCENPR